MHKSAMQARGRAIPARPPVVRRDGPAPAGEPSGDGTVDVVQAALEGAREFLRMDVAFVS